MLLGYTGNTKVQCIYATLYFVLGLGNISIISIIVIAIIISHYFGLVIISHYVFLTYDYFIHEALSTVNYV